MSKYASKDYPEDVGFSDFHLSCIRLFLGVVFGNFQMKESRLIHDSNSPEVC